jgi:hypothetical protein
VWRRLRTYEKMWPENRFCSWLPHDEIRAEVPLGWENCKARRRPPEKARRCSTPPPRDENAQQ